MEVNYPSFAISNLIPIVTSKIDFAKELSIAAGAKAELLELYDEVYAEILKLQSIIKENNFSTEYVTQLAKELDKFTSAFPRGYGSDSSRKPITLQDEEKPIFKNSQERDETQIREALLRFKATFDFFMKFNFLNDDLVIVGANGSGKTSLANDLKRHIKENGVVVSAQRVLLLPTFDDIKSVFITSTELKRIQIGDKTNKHLDIDDLQSEFTIVIRNLLAENAESNRNYSIRARENSNQGKKLDPPALTNLERTIDIWNSLFSKPKIFCDDGMNIMARNNETSYSVMEMSEGEKVALFLIAQVLQCPINGFIIVDEPEIYLHPTIHKKLWDCLEIERPDSVFIYFTHDLDFASSRTTMKKLWLRSFNYPGEFTLEEMPTNEIPPVLLLELLGSRQNIMFCEGVMGSLDEKIYRILFPDYTIKPVGSCTSVINFTKAFNEIPNSATKAVGIIDADYQPQQRLKPLEEQRIFGLKLAEVENLLFDEAILNAICNEQSFPIENVQKIKNNVLSRLKKDRDFQISNYVSARLDNYFKDSNVPRGKNISTLMVNYEGFLKYVNIPEWTRERAFEIDKIVSDENYYGAIQIFNNKGLESIANSVFNVKDFNDRAIKLLEKDIALQLQLLNHFPDF